MIKIKKVVSGGFCSDSIVKDNVKKINIKDVILPGWKVDKAKIKYILRSHDEVQKIADNLACDTRVTSSFESGDLKKCKFNYTLGFSEGVVYIGLEDNSNRDLDESRKTIKIEYNPQKVNIFKEVRYLRDLKSLDLHRRYIMYLDLAYDMYVDVSCIEYEKRRVNEYCSLHEHEKLETIYLRSLGSNGAIRIYDKTKEKNRGISKVEDDTGEIYVEKYYGDCTRYEIRIKPEGRNNQLLMNIADPYFIKWLVDLGKIGVKNEDVGSRILKRIEEYKGNDFTNLLAVHMGYASKLNNRAKAKYKDIYNDIKKELLGSNPKSSVLNDFNYDCLFKTINSYINSITINVEKQSYLLFSTLVSL